MTHITHLSPMTDHAEQNRNTPRAVAIIPAAGESQRMGAAKLLLPWATGTVIAATVGGWRRSCVGEVIIVVSPASEPLAEAARDAGAAVVVPSSTPADMKASLQHGIRFATAQCGRNGIDCFLVAPADMPWIEPAVIDRLVAEFNAGSSAIVAPTHHGRRGHPIVLAWRLAEDVLRLGDDETLKSIVQRYEAKEIECDASVLGDLDTPEDYRIARQQYGC